jgi:methyl-accepting chemotaxis protein
MLDMFSSGQKVKSAEQALDDVETLLAVVNRAAEGTFPNEIKVSNDSPVSDLADGLQSVLGELSSTKERLAARENQLDALDKSQAVIEFEVDGTIKTANANFLAAVGYSLDEIQGQHHRIFVDPVYAASAEYRQFWKELGEGDFKTAEYQRFKKDGSPIWIQASYNPVFGADGKPYKVVKYASDITAQKVQSADYEGQLGAIGKSQAVISFELDGTIRTANENFLNAVGYSLHEIKGKHHRIFAEPAYAASAEYQQFWTELANGDYKAGEFKRIRKDGQTIWIQASYNPIKEAEGKP